MSAPPPQNLAPQNPAPGGFGGHKGPPRPHPLLLVEEWIGKAEGDLGSAAVELDRARQNPSGGKHHANADDVLFHSQQCIEKLFKAALEQHGGKLIRTHDLVALDIELARVVRGWAADQQDLNTLNAGAVQYRYPGASATLRDAEDAFAACLRLVPRILAIL